MMCNGAVEMWTSWGSFADCVWPKVYLGVLNVEIFTYEPRDAREKYSLACCACMGKLKVIQ